PGLTRRELKEWYKAQRRLAMAHQQFQGAGVVINSRVHPFGGFDDRPLEERVIAFRRSVVGWLGWSAVLFGINAAMQGVPWFFIPSAFMCMNVLRKGGSIWSDGVGPFEAFSKGIRAKLRAEHGPAALVGRGGVGVAAAPTRTPQELA